MESRLVRLIADPARPPSHASLEESRRLTGRAQDCPGHDTVPPVDPLAGRWMLNPETPRVTGFHPAISAPSGFLVQKADGSVAFFEIRRQT